MIEIADERASHEALKRFHFIEPPIFGGMNHMNRIGDTLLLQVDMFCIDVISGLEQWIADTEENEGVQERIATMLKVYPPPGSPNV